MSTLDLLRKIGLTDEEKEHLAVTVGLKLMEPKPVAERTPYDEKKYHQEYARRNRERLNRNKRVWREKRNAGKGLG